MKQCTVCKELKPLTEFDKRQDVSHAKRQFGEHRPPTYDKGKYFSSCKLCRGIAVKLRKFGITREEYDQLPNHCEACDNPDRTLCIDHDHETGQVRGILCHNCNVVLGLMGDDPERIEALLTYIRRTTGAFR